MREIAAALSMLAGVSGLGAASMAAGPESAVRVDLPKVNLRIPAAAADPREAVRQMSVAVTLFIPEDGLGGLEWRSGDIRRRIFDACAASYFRVRAGETEGLDLELLREHVAEEVRASLGRRDLAILFRELTIR